MPATFDLNLGVTFHSFTNEWVSCVWSFEDLMHNAGQLGGGVEIVGPAHHRDFPNVPDEFVTAFRSARERHGLTPTSYGSYADPFMRFDGSALSDDELVAYHLPQLRGAARLGFPIVRLQYYAAGIVERLLPTSEKLGVRLGYELHCPLNLDNPTTLELVAQCDRLDTPHLGLIPDAGIFSRSIPAFRRQRGIATGLSPEPVDKLVALWSDPSKGRGDGEELVASFGAGSESAEWAVHLWGSHGHSDPADLGQIFRHVIHVHAKFFSMLDGDEPDVRYRDLVFALLDNSYRGWISSEYEGPPTDSFQVVAEQQAMMRRYIDEYAKLHR